MTTGTKKKPRPRKKPATTKRAAPRKPAVVTAPAPAPPPAVSTAEPQLAALFTWRSAVASKHGPHSSVRLVLLTLGLHMNEKGGSCFPSQATLAEETGLTIKTVRDRLQEAEEQGWIIRGEKGASGQGWKRHEYRAVIPVHVLSRFEGGEGITPRSDTPEGGEAFTPRSPEEGGEGFTPRSDEGGEGITSPSTDADEGGVNDGEKVGYDLPPSTSVSTSDLNSNNSAREAVDDEQLRHQVIADMWSFVNAKLAGRPEDEAEKKRAGVAGLITGEDRIAWQDPSGTPAPWAERARLFVLAFYDAIKTSREIRNSLRYTVIPQQLDPFEQAKNTGRKDKAGGVDENPGGGRRGAAGQLEPIGGVVPSISADAEAERAAAREETRKVEEWRTANPERAASLAADIFRDEEKKLAGCPAGVIQTSAASRTRVAILKLLQEGA